MTRGYFVLLEGRKIIDAAYLNSDAYPSYYGVEFLDAILEELDQPRSFERHLLSMQKDSADAWDSSDPASWAKAKREMTMKWFKKGRDCGEYGYADYAYLYDSKSGIITVTNFGTPTFRFSAENAATAKEIFKNWDWLQTSFSTDDDFFNSKNQSVAFNTVNDLMEEGCGYGEILQFALSRPHISISKHKRQSTEYARCPEASYTVEFLVQENGQCPHWSRGTLSIFLHWVDLGSTMRFEWPFDAVAYNTTRSADPKRDPNRYKLVFYSVRGAKYEMEDFMLKIRPKANMIGRLLDITNDAKRSFNYLKQRVTSYAKMPEVVQPDIESFLAELKEKKEEAEMLGMDLVGDDELPGLTSLSVPNYLDQLLEKTKALGGKG